VNLVAVISCYRWEGKVAKDEEVLMIIKTEQRMVKPLMTRLPQLHSYKVPKIIVLPVAEGLGPYLDWISESIAVN
jgi:periplasmic divalent cation tolerance protein